MSHTTVGTCSICSGAVTVTAIWGGIYPPTPTCSRCGATPREPHGPVIPMQPRRHQPIITGTIAVRPSQVLEWLRAVDGEKSLKDLPS